MGHSGMMMMLDWISMLRSLTLIDSAWEGKRKQERGKSSHASCFSWEGKGQENLL
uniref:Splicing factor U2AF-associated protein 2 isoform X1 n=1 Tax=Rhizophora mucronata TaxID=61149 RepID=A0A2P2KQ13_RHIMU